MSTTTATDRARLVDLALAHGWEVSNFSDHWTELLQDGREIVINWNADDSLYAVESYHGEPLTTDQAEAANLLRGERLRDAANARYFEVVEPADGNLENADYRETDKHHAFVQLAFISHREACVLAGLARDARSLAKATGSRYATNVETVFGVELHVTWKRA